MKKKSKSPAGVRCTATACGGALKCMLEGDHSVHSTSTQGRKAVQYATWSTIDDGRIRVITYSSGKKQSEWFEGASTAPVERRAAEEHTAASEAYARQSARLADTSDEPDNAARWHCEAPFVGSDGREHKCEGRNEHNGSHYAWSLVHKKTVYDKAAPAATEDPDELDDAHAVARANLEPEEDDDPYEDEVRSDADRELARQQREAREAHAAKLEAAKEPDIYSADACKKCGEEMGAHDGKKCPKPEKKRQAKPSQSRTVVDAQATSVEVVKDSRGRDVNVRIAGAEVPQAQTALARVEEQPAMLSVEMARQFLAKSISVDEVRDVRDRALAIEMYLRTRDASRESQNDAAEIRLRAERRLGELTAEMPKAPPDKRGQGRKAANQVAKPDLITKAGVLAEQGIKKQDASKWQQLAKIPEKKFEKFVEDTKAKGDRLTASAPLKMVRQEAKAKAAEELRAKPIPQVTGRFNVIVIDPPWKYDKRAEDITQRGQGDYPRMEIEAIKALPVADRAEDNCILWCWTTNGFMRQALECLDAWGFEEKTILTWCKDRMGNGDWLRGKTEHCILAVRGSPIVTLTNETTELRGDVREHSRKPETFYQLVERLCPGTKLEMFAREPHSEQWAVWGNEVDKFATEAA